MSSATPDPAMLQLLMDMGYSQEMATQALFATGNSNADLAAAWLLDQVSIQLFSLYG